MFYDHTHLPDYIDHVHTRISFVMVDYLGDLQLAAGDNGRPLRVTLEAWEGDEDNNDGIRIRHSPPERPFSSLEETEDGDSCSLSEVGAGVRGPSHSPPPPVNIPSEEYDDHLLYANVPDPIRLRGVGGTTMFGLNNHFEDEFPAHLVGKVMYNTINEQGS